MRLQVVEAVCQPAGAANEDRWGARDDMAVWVVDGATGVADERVLPGPSDALWFVEQIDGGLRGRATSGNTPGDVLRPIIRQTREAFAKAALRPDAAAVDLPGGALAMLRLIEGTAELSSLGDCRIVHRDDRGAVSCFGTSKVTALDDLLVEEVVRLQGLGLSPEVIWSRVLPMTRRHRALANQPDGYWRLDLDERALAHIEIERRPARLGDAFLLLSDGFYRLVDVYRRYSYETLFDAAQQKGLAPLAAELRAIEAADPECRRFPRLKPRDDATAVMVRLA
ncbi:MAG TPA: PP2C family serine/threonine-protein phosphatase [Stellaceae bacterium]